MFEFFSFYYERYKWYNWWNVNNIYKIKYCTQVNFLIMIVPWLYKRIFLFFGWIQGFWAAAFSSSGCADAASPNTGQAARSHWLQDYTGPQPTLPYVLPTYRQIPIVAFSREMVVLLVPTEVNPILLDMEGHFISLYWRRC